MQVFVVRLFDIFLFEGMKIMYRCAIFILQTYEKALLSMEMGDCMMFLQRQVEKEPRFSLADETIEAILKVISLLLSKLYSCFPLYLCLDMYADPNHDQRVAKV